ncbi:TPA: hypothetical protein N0F65_006463 [Lagenidium giganteum]|uniref:Uncharacterized protein n=1 Tax=Lagenidium giganteum TaxID=4803 RepID=A0AAV2Z4T2_9STRA|nr:TPA: hypothetical protein N0F65_006463 [Lagenidium giganteum]
MKTRVWEDSAAMSIVSVLGYPMNDDGEVVGAERTRVLCQLLPSIHTLTHRAILAMLITSLNDADARTFYNERGLRVLNEWLLEGVKKKEPGMSKEKRRIELFSQVRALIRVLDVNVQTDAARKQNSFLNEAIHRLVEFLDNAGSEYAPEWSKLNIYRRHFESTCGPYVRPKSDGASKDKDNTATKVSPRGPAPTTDTAPKPKPATAPTSTSSSSGSSGTSTSSNGTSSSTPAAPRVPSSSVLQYQPKSFLQPEAQRAPNHDENSEFIEDDEEDLGVGEELITNVSPSLLNASLDIKIRKNGHQMDYMERANCVVCRKMSAKRCIRCACCPKCAQKVTCNNSHSSQDPATITKPSGATMSVTERNKNVLGSAMDQAIFKAFKNQDFHSLFSLIQNGQDVNFQRIESDMSTGLMAAAHHGRDDAANKLLTLGANPTLVDKDNSMAWQFAAKRGHQALADKLKKAAEEWPQQTKSSPSQQSAATRAS